MDDDVEAGLTEVMRTVFDRPELVVTPGMSAKDVAGWDSHNLVLLIVELESRFGIVFRSSEIETLRTTDDFIALIRNKRR